MVDPDDVEAFVLRQLWDQVHALARQFHKPEEVYEQLLEDLVCCLQFQELPGRDVAALLAELLRKYRDQLIDFLP